MTIEKQTEVAPVKEESSTNKPEATEATSSQPEKTIPVDIYNTTVELPLSKAKEIIAKRDSKTKEYNELKSKIEKAEQTAKQEAERATLLQLMQKQDAEAVEAQVSQKYRDTIAKFEKKVYEGEIKATLSRLGVIGEAIPDATKLVLSDAKAELDGENIKLNGVNLEEYLKDWASKKPHLVSAKAVDGKKLGKPTTPKAPEKSGADRLNNGLSKFIKA